MHGQEFHASGIWPVAAFNTLLDLRPILMEYVGALTTLTDFVNIILLSWLFGAFVAAVHNLSKRLEGTEEP